MSVSGRRWSPSGNWVCHIAMAEGQPRVLIAAGWYSTLIHRLENRYREQPLASGKIYSQLQRTVCALGTYCFSTSTVRSHMSAFISADGDSCMRHRLGARSRLQSWILLITAKRSCGVDAPDRLGKIRVLRMCQAESSVTINSFN